NQPQGIHQQMAFAAFDLFAPIKADLRSLGGRLDALTVHTARRRLRLPPLAATLALPQSVHQLGPHSGLSPRLEIRIDRIPLAELPRQHAPLTARLEQIPDPIEHLAQVARRAPGTSRAPFPRRE